MTQTAELPLFPLRTVLFTDGQLPLRIFEPRYTAMVSRCLKEDIGFGVVLLRQGADTRSDAGSPAPEIFDIGTEARIVDFNPLANGVLGIVAQGGRKFQVERTWEQDDLLLMGEVSYLPAEPSVHVGEEHGDLVAILAELVRHPSVSELNLQIDFDDARAVGWRLAELLPIEPEAKQDLLQLEGPDERLLELRRLVEQLRA